MAEDAKNKEISSIMPDWSQLPEELLPLISNHLENCFDVCHARSVCRLWRSTFLFPSRLLRHLPAFADFPFESRNLCTFKEVPLFLFRVRAPHAAAALPLEYFLGGLSRDKSEDRIERLPSPLQCSVKVEIPGSDPVLLNFLDCQIFSLGYQYRMIGWDPRIWTKNYRGMAFLPLNKEGGGEGEFVVLLNYARNLLLLKSAEMRWMQLEESSDSSCSNLVAFRGKFYAVFLNGDIFVIDPYSMQLTLLMPYEPLHSTNFLIPSGNDELFLVEHCNPFAVSDLFDGSLFACRVSKLDETAGEWVMINDLGDRVLFIGELGNVSCLAKELPDGCGLSRNSIVFISEPGDVTFYFKYGVHTGRAEDGLNYWRSSRANRVMILNR